MDVLTHSFRAAWLISVLDIGLLWAGLLGVASAKPLNVVLFVVDDLGVHDLSVAGSEVCETPRIDAFAADGVWFSQAYAAYPSETTNLADKLPRVRDRLMVKLAAWKKEMKVKDRA